MTSLAGALPDDVSAVSGNRLGLNISEPSSSFLIMLDNVVNSSVACFESSDGLSSTDGFVGTG